MELSRQALEEVKFKTKGKWYSAEQVDFFIDELAKSFELIENEKDAMRREIMMLREELNGVHGLHNEINRLQAELSRMGFLKEKADRLERERLDAQALLAENERLKADVEKSRSVVSERPLTRAGIPDDVYERLEQERDEIIEDIKMLRRFREEFKESVRNDATELLSRLDSMGSNIF